MVTLFPNVCNTWDFCEVGLSLRGTDLKELFNTRQTLGRIVSQNATTTVLRVKGQLRAWLTDTLRRDDTNRVPICDD